MSHFTVLVVGDVESQMAKYDENMEVEPYLMYTRESAAKELTDKIAEYEAIVAKNDNSRYNIAFCIECLNRYKEHTPASYFMELATGYEKDAEGNPLTTYNKNSKWDWYSVGGRWEGYFTLKDGTKSDSARKGDIDFKAMSDERTEAAAARWDKAVKTCNGDNETDKNKRYWEYDINEEQWKAGKDAYIESARKTAINTFAVVKDGEWFEKGNMGWFACVTNENKQWPDEFESLLTGVPDDEILTLLDCHI